MRISFRKLTAKRGGKVLLALLTSVLLWEMALRHLQRERVTEDPLFGMVQAPGVMIHRLNEGMATGHWDAEGIRVTPLAPVIGPRLLVLGDSFAEATQVNDDEVFTTWLQRRWPELRVTNAGHSGHSPADYVGLGPRYLHRFNPVWTVIEVSSDDFTYDGFDAAKTHFIDRDAREVTVVPFRAGRTSPILMTLRAHSAFLDDGISKAGRYRMSSRMPPLFRAADVDRTRSPAPDGPVEAEMDRMSETFGGRVTLAFVASYGPRDAIESRFIAHCGGRHFSCVDLRDSFAEFKARGDAPTGFPNSSFGSGHMNAAGHAALGRLLNRELERVRSVGLF